MKPTQVTELFANIRASFVSFFSILMFASLGVGIFVGINWAHPALEKGAGEVFQRDNLHVFQVQFPYGLTEADIGSLRALEGVDDVEAGRSSFQTAVLGDSSYTVKAQSAPARIDVPETVEGEMPQAPGELALEATWAQAHDVKVGDTITFEHDAETAGDEGGTSDGEGEAAGDPLDSKPDPDGMSYLTSDTYVVTGLAESVEYLSTELGALGFSTLGSGRVDVVAWLAPGSFDADAYQDGFTVVNVAAQGIASLGTYTDECAKASSELQGRVEELGTGLAKARYQDVHAQAADLVADGEKRLDEARAQVADGEKRVADGQRQIDDGQGQIADGEAQLADAKAQLASGEAQLAEALPQLQDGQAKLDSARKTFDAKVAELEKAKKALAMVDAAKAEIEALSALVTKEDGVKEAAAATLDAAREAAESNLDAAIAALDEQREAGEIDEDEYDAAVEAAREACESAVAAAQGAYDTALAQSDGRISAACKAAMKKFENATGQSLPSGTLTPDTVRSLLPQALDALADNARYEFDGKKMSIGEARKLVKEGESETAKRRSQLADAERELAAKWDEYHAGEAKLDEVRAQISSGTEQLEEAKASLKDAKRQLEDAKEKLADGKGRLVSGERKLEDAKQQLDGMREFAWTVLPRSFNGGVAAISTYGSVVDKLCYSMAALFVFVGLLVSYSAVSRIVHEQVTQIGTKKALGLRRREITAGFLAYSAIAVTVGAVVGIAVGVFAVEAIILGAMAPRFVLAEFAPYFDPALSLAVTAVYLALVLGATWFACRNVLKEQAVELLKGEKPPEARQRFYERLRAWERLPLFTQTVVNNCANDKRRVFSTVVGVAGCTALIGCAITLNDDVLASFDKQYEDLYRYDAIAYVDAAEAGDEAPGASATGPIRGEVNDLGVVQAKFPVTPGEQVAEVLADAGCPTTPVYRRATSLKLPNGGQIAVSMVVPADEKAYSQFHEIVAVDGAAVDLERGGVWVAEAAAVHQGLRIGDTVQVPGTDGSVHELEVAGFFEHYLTGVAMVCGRAFYEEEFGGSFAANALLVDTGGADFAELRKSLRSVDGFRGLANDKESNRADFVSFSDISRTVVLVYLTLAALMALVVLLNLNVMFIEEKKRDLIVLMINGFSVKDAKRYITSDTVVLTALGIALGVILGCAMGSFTVAAIEPDGAVLLKGIAWRAVAASVVGTALLAFAMNRIALRRIPAFKLTDVNKV